MEFKESKVNKKFLGCEQIHTSKIKFAIMVCSIVLCNIVQFIILYNSSTSLRSLKEIGQLVQSPKESGCFDPDQFHLSSNLDGPGQRADGIVVLNKEC